MSKNNPHLLKSNSLFALFCLSYLPLFFLLILKLGIANFNYLHFHEISTESLITFFEKFGFITILIILGSYGMVGTYLTLKNIKQKESNAIPAKVASVKLKNEEALSYLTSYVLPLLISGAIGAFEYATFGVLFFLYYKLYSTSSLILINPILNMKYGLYEIEYISGTKQKSALIISQHKWIDIDDEIKILKLSHKLYFAY